MSDRKVLTPASRMARNIAIALTIIGAIALAYGLYLVIVQPFDANINISEAQQRAASRARGINIIWISALVIVIPWLVWWLFF